MTDPLRIEGITLGGEYSLSLIEGAGIEVSVESIEARQLLGGAASIQATDPETGQFLDEWHPDYHEPIVERIEPSPLVTVRCMITASVHRSLPGLIIEMTAEEFHRYNLDADVEAIDDPEK